MKTKIKRMSKRTLAMLLGVLMLVTSIGLGTIITANAALPTKIYFIPNTDWYNSGNVVMKANFNNNDSSWNAVTMTLDDASARRYSVTVPSGVNKVQFLRGSTGTWSQWDYSQNVSIPTDGKNLFTLNSGWSGTSGTWSTYTPPATTYSITVASGLSNGSISSNVTKAAKGATVTITGNPDDGYKLNTVTVTDANNASVNVSGSGNERTFVMPASNVNVTATFTALPTTTIRIKKSIANTFPNAFIWSEGVGNLKDWAGEAIKSSPWESDSTYTDYYVRTFQKDWESFQVILNGTSGQTGDSTTYAIGGTYYIDSATARENGDKNSNKVVLLSGVPEIKYSVTVTADTGGKIQVGSAAASENQTATVGATTTATVTAVPDTGYHFTGWTKSANVSYASGDASSANVTINASGTGSLTAAFAKTDYTITDSAGSNGTVSHSGTSQYGQTITVTATPEAHYSLDTLSVYKTGDPNTKVTVTNNQFTMPAYNVTISATFAETKYNVTVNNNGTSSIKSTGYFTSQSTGAHAAKTGYTQNGWEVTSGSVYVNGTKYTNGQTISGDSITFTTEEVAALTALYTANTHKVTYSNAADQYTISNVSSGASGSSVAYGTTVSYTVSGVTNDTVKYVVTDVTVDGATSPTYDTSTGAGSFTMPDSDVQIVPTGKFQYKVTFSQPSNGTLTVKNGSTNVTSGSYVDANANLTVTLKTNEGYELNTATGVTFGEPTATTSSLTYTGSVTVDAAKVFSVSTKAISQHTVTLTGNNVTFQVKYTKNKKAVTTYTDYSAPLVVDNGSTLSVKAVTSGFYSISEWKDGTTTLANTDAEQTFTVSSDKNITATATKSSSSDCIYVKLSNVGTKIYYYLYGSQTNGDFPGKLMVNGSTLGSDVAYDSTTGIYCISGDGSGSPLKDGAGIVFSDGTDHYKSGDLTVNLGSTYTIKSGGDGYGHQWGADVQKVGDPTENTVLKISKKSGADTDITGVYIYGGSDLLGSFDDCKNNIKNNTTSIASKATLDKTSDANYYIVTIPNINFTSSDGLFNAIVIINGHANDGDQTSDIEGKQIGYTYVIDIKNYNGSSKKFDVEVSSEDEGDAKYYLAGEYSDGTSQFFGTAWSPNTNELTKNGSVYEKTFTSNIPAGTIKFKVVKNGDWDEGSWPDENQTYVIQPNATSVKFSFNPTTGKITVTQTNSEGGGDTVTGWMYSGTAAANRTEVNPTSGMTTFDASKEQSNEYGKFRFMYGTSDNSLTNVIVPSNYKTGDDSNAYWAELTSSMSKDNNAHFFFGLTNYWNQGNMVGNKGEEINDSTGNKVITDKDGSNLFTIATQEHNDVTSSAKFVNIYGVNWEKVAAIGVKAYDNSKSTNGNNTHSNKVDYQIYYKAKVAAPVKEAQVVDIVAKNGTLRDSTFNRFTNLANTDFVDYFSYEETDAEGVTTYDSIDSYNSAHSSKQIVIENDINYGGSTYAKMTNVPVGAKIKLKTTLSSNAAEEGSFDEKAFKDTHYLKGYSFNGMTYEIHEPNTSGVYEETWTVRAVNTTYTDKNDALQQATTNGNTVEVTPVYYMKDTTNVKTFYIDGYDGEVQEAWGNMLTVYPYYEGISNSGNAFGGYPGQPMLFWGGKYQMEIPLTVDGTATGASVKGLTLHNGYWDLLHRSIDIRCNTRNHAQTYDYDDFYKLYKEKDPDTIIFDFKYRTKTDNYGDGYNYTNYTFAGNTAKSAADFVNENGVELVTDYFGRQVDAFGNLIKDAEKSDWDTTQVQDKELLFVSTGYKDTYVGEYATLWAVYAPETDMKGGDTSNKFIGYISSSMLYLKDFDRVKQYAGGTLETNGRMSWSEFKSTYNHLKTYYTGVPALISYEKEIWNDSKDKANRSDGKWYYSNKSDKIQASIKIQYGPYSLFEAPDHSVSSDAWKDDPFDATQTGVGGQKNIGTSTNCSAYFTNTSPNLLGKVESGEQFADSTKTFTFQAVPSGSYMFAGWVRYSNGKYYEITEKELGSSSMSANDVYIARFVTAKTGTLTVQHVVEQTDTFTGTGTPELTVTIKNGDTVVNTTGNHVSDGSKIDVSKWIDIRNKDYKIDITLKTTPTNESFMKEIVSSSGNFAASPNKWNTDKTATDSSNADTGAQTTTVAQFTVGEILDSGVTSLRYVSHLMKPKYTYKYSIVYTYTSRFWGEQSYTVTGTFDNDSDFAANATGSKTSAKLNTDFIINKTPYEKNFRQTINWNYTSSAVGNAKAMENKVATDDGNNTYTMTAHVYSANDVSKKVKAEIFLPYNLNDFSEDTGYTAKGMDVYRDTTGGSKTGETAVVYDDTVEPVSLETEAYKLFTYAGEKVSGGNDVIPSSLKLVEAAPYVLCKSYDSATGKYTPVDFHTHLASTKRYMTGNSFKVGNVTYYLNQFPEGVTEDETHKVINASNVDSDYTVTFRKPGNDYDTTYKYAVPGKENGHNVIYFFAYNMNDKEQMVDNHGDATTTPVFNGQYIIYREYDEVDGVVQGNYQKKYFTRWDITNSKGEFVASCYSRKFNYTGYENYVVRAIYESDVEQEFYNEGSEGTSASITYLGDTRNQWNNGALGDYANVTKKSDGNIAGDKLLHDFAITYYYNGKEIQAIESNEKEIKVGMMIEQLGKLETIGGEKVYDSSYYANEYKGNNTRETLKNCLEHGGNPKDTTNLTTINSKIGANVANFGTKFGTAANTATAKMNFNSVIDNFNRLQWFYTFNNTKTDGVIGENNNANYAYRAWSYIIVGGVATVSSTPAYFTLYDSAHR